MYNYRYLNALIKFIIDDYEKLIEKITNSMVLENDNKEIQNTINFKAEYFYRILNNKSEENPFGLLYSKNDYEDLEKTLIEFVEDSFDMKFNTYMSRLLAEAGFEGDLKQKNRDLEAMFNKIGRASCR